MKYLLIALLTITPLFANDAYLGIYDLDVTIGETKFHDILFLEQLEPNGEKNEFLAKGQFEVPGNFKVPFKGKLCLKCDEDQKNKISLRFEANENGNKFFVELKAEFNSPIKLTGTLSSGGSVFGNFVGAKKINKSADIFMGDWKGPCIITPSIPQFEDTVAELNINRRDKNTLNWTIKYFSQSGNQIRPYEFKTINAEKGRFVIDEKNGFLLDSYVFGDKLFASFKLGDLLLSSTYQRQGNQIIMEIPTYLYQPIRETCLDRDNTQCVESLEASRLQRCYLTKI